MSTQSVTVTDGPLPKSIGPTGWARSLLKRKLSAIREGRLEVTDPWGKWSVGSESSIPAQIKVDSPSFYLDVALGGGLGAARSWIEGGWTSPDDLTSVLRLLLRNIDVVDNMEGGSAALISWLARIRHAFRSNSIRGSKENIHRHYDLGNDLFALFLDESLTYSCAIFDGDDTTLAAAQTEKLDRICRKLTLEPTDHVVEIGTGWGSFAIHAASHYGCRITTTTISKEQFNLATARVVAAGLTDKITVLLEDYRNLEGQFDKLVSIEMVEAVGHQYLPTYFGACARLLREDGAMLIQAITMPDQRYAQYLKASDFIQEYIFPGSCCPALSAMLTAVRTNTDMKLSHLEDIGEHYARTLRLWRERFDAKEQEVISLGYPQSFLRLWRYYLCYCEAGFAERYTGTVQLLLEKPRRRAPALLGSL